MPCILQVDLGLLDNSELFCWPVDPAAVKNRSNPLSTSTVQETENRIERLGPETSQHQAPQLHRGPDMFGLFWIVTFVTCPRIKTCCQVGDHDAVIDVLARQSIGKSCRCIKVCFAENTPNRIQIAYTSVKSEISFPLGFQGTECHHIYIYTIANTQRLARFLRLPILQAL